MLAHDLSTKFLPVPKPKDTKKKKSTKIKQKSSKLAKLEKNRFSIITDDLEHCYMCTERGIKGVPRDDFIKLIGQSYL